MKPLAKYEHQLDEHFGSLDGAKWQAFIKHIRTKGFQEAVKNDPRADEKLRRFANLVGKHLSSKTKPIKVPSSDGKTKYNVKYHSDIDRYTCSCGDWTYNRSIKTNPKEWDCKHIVKVKELAPHPGM